MPEPATDGVASEHEEVYLDARPVRLGQLLFQSLREDPAGAHSDAERLLVRAGFMRQVDPVGRVLLPLGAMALRRITGLFRAELDGLDCHEVTLPGAPPEPRASQDDPEDELPSGVVARELFRSVVRSHRQLPSRAFAVHGVSRDAGRGQARERDRVVADALVAESDLEALAATLAIVESRVLSVLSQLELPVTAAEWAADATRARALVQVGHGHGDEIVVCPECGYAADRRIAGLRDAEPEREEPGTLEEVATPGTTTIASLAEFLGVGPERCAKAAFYALEDGRLLTAIVRGDDEVSETKLALAVGVSRLVPATEEAIRAAGMEPGYGSPVGVAGTYVVADRLAMASPNLVAGANQAGFHLRNVNAGRDYVASVVADIARVVPGDGCPHCPGTLALARGTPLCISATVVGAGGPACADSSGARRDIAIGVARIEVERILAAVVETLHDDRGIVWPEAAAPFPAHVVVLSADRDPRVADAATELASAARRSGRRLLWDDRDESPGVKFADADLLGIPLRLTVSPRSVAAGGVEVSHRRSGERSILSVDEAGRLVGGEDRGQSRIPSLPA